MKIVLYVNSFLPHIGGRELVVHQLALSLRRLGHEVRVIGPGGWWKYHSLDFGYRVLRYPVLARNLPDILKLFQLYVDIKMNGCDVIHAHVTFPCGYLAARLKRFLSIPLVITPHGVDIHVIPELGHGLRLDPLLEPKISFALAEADALTAISGSVAASLLDAGASAAKIVDLPNGVDIDRFDHGNGRAARQRLKLSDAAKIIVIVGNYHLRKGHEVLVRAMPRIMERIPDVHLVIVGRGNEALNPLIQELGMSGHVHCLGELPLPLNSNPSPDAPAGADPLADLYRAADIYVSAGISEGAEGLSLALLEAMAARLCIVASDISGNRDILKDGQNGMLVPAGDVDLLATTIIKLLADSSLRETLGHRARDTVEQYRWDVIAQKYVDVYEKVCGHS